MSYLDLSLAIAAEVVGTAALKAAHGFTRPGPSLLVAVGYGLAFFFLSRALQTIPLGIAYAIWSGVGLVLITLLGRWLYRQTLDLAALLGMALIVAGVSVLKWAA
jgi:small multidrug resistance pump